MVHLSPDHAVCPWGMGKRHRAVCDAIDWQTTENPYQGWQIWKYQREFETEPDSVNVCNPYLCSYWGGWRPEHFSVAMPQPVTVLEEVR